MYEPWYREHYHEMSGAGHWFDGHGFNLLTPDLWDSRLYRVLIVRLSTVRDTADSYTHRLLYSLAAGCEGIYADCAWLPPPEDGTLFSRDGIPWLTGIVTKRPALNFDCIAISNSIVQEIVNISLLLANSGIPLEKRERMNRSEVPLVLLGGANALFTSVLVGEDPPVDAVFVGENTSHITSLFTAGRDAKTVGAGKRTVLSRWRAIPGVIEHDAAVATVKVRDNLDGRQLFVTMPVFAGEACSGSGTLQISDGCPCFCTFCAEGWGRKPYREVAVETAVGVAAAMKAAMGLDRIDLYSFNFNMYSGLRELLFELAAYFPVIGLKSQRLDGIADDPELLKLEHAAGKSSMTVGVEGISSRMRRRLQKGLDDTKLHAGLKLLLAAPIRELKLFFLATGSEEEVDFTEFRDLMVFIAETMRQVRRQPRIIISMTPLVRFPFTPLEHEDAPDAAVVARIIQQCERIVQAKRFEFRSAASMNDYLFSQIVVRATDRRVYLALCKAIEATGFVFYNEISGRFMNEFMQQLEEAGCDTKVLLTGMTPAGRLPVTITVHDSFMEQTYRSAVALRDTGHCLGTLLREGECGGCGGCEDNAEKERMTSRVTVNVGRVEKLRVRLQENSRLVNLYLHCTIAASLRGVSHRFTAAKIAKLFMEYRPELTRWYRGYGGSAMENRFATEWMHGDEIITLQFVDRASDLLTALCGDSSFLTTLNTMLSEECTVTDIDMNEPSVEDVSLRIISEYGGDPSRYLTKTSLKHMLTRSGDGWTVYQLTKEALKKQVLRSIRSLVDGQHTIIELETGTKFNYNEFLRTVFAGFSPNELLKILCEATIIHPRQ